MFLKEYLRNKALKKINFSRDVRYLNINEFNSIGFLFPVTDSRIPETIERMITILEHRGIYYRGLALAYFDKDSSFSSIEKITVVDRNCLKYADIPDLSLLDNFLKEEFDLLVDFSLSYSFPSDLIVRASLSGLKIGRLNYEKYPYDFVVNNQDPSHRGYLNSMIHYLSSIKAS